MKPAQLWNCDTDGGEVEKTSDSECYTSLPEPFRTEIT